jgi:predicted Rossmann fold flavoprotein
LGLPVVEPVPALVPLRSPAGWVHALSGVSLQDVEVRLHDPADRIVARRARPIVFTHHGLSGPGAMDLSVHVARAQNAAWTIALDLLPDRPLEEVREALAEAARQPGAPHLARVLGESLPARLRAAATAQAGLPDDPNPALHRVERKIRNRLADALKGLRVPIHGTLGWDKAEVTGGGLALDAVDRGSMQVKGHPGLYVFGELLDLQGPIGGLNFQAAFATGELAARHVAKT